MGFNINSINIRVSENIDGGEAEEVVRSKSSIILSRTENRITAFFSQ